MRMRRVAFALAAPVAAFVLTVIISTIALWLFDSDPFEAYGDMISHARKLETQVDILNRATPFYLSAVAAAIGFRMNLFNIGVEGQYLIALLFAAQVGGMISLPAVLHIALIMLTAMVIGSLYAGIAGVLKTTRGVNEVVSTIMLNAIAVSGLIAWLQREWQAELGENFSSSDLGTEPIDESGLLPTINWLPELIRPLTQGKELTGMLLVAVAVGIAYHVLLNRTRFGFDLRASGINPFAARAGGVPPKRMVVAAMMMSGAIAGLIGMVELADRGKFPPDPIQGLGFAGIAVALLGRNHPGGMVFSALLFAFLDVSSGVLDTTGAASREIAIIMQGIVLLTAVIAYGVTSRLRERDEARAAAEALQDDGSASSGIEAAGASA